jgi:ribonucleoside-diphosphate reductase alpha chain
MSIKIDLSRDALFDELGMIRLKESYMREDETSPQERFAYVSNAFASSPEHAQRLYDYSSKHWLSYSTPILSFGRGKRGLPISCFLSYLGDSAEGLVDTLSEVNWLSMLGGGVGIHVGIRGVDEKSVGVMPHLRVYDASCLAYRQGRTRRGSYAAFLDISHPDIIQFLEMRKPTGDQNMRTLNLHHGINISDKFMALVEGAMRDPDFDDTWELVSPNSGEVVERVSARELWQKLLEIRMQTGEPYLIFIDNANKALPSWLSKQGLKINGSNLCVAPETLILTRGGYQEISTLEGQDVEVWNGEEWSRTTVVKTGEDQNLITVKTNSGYELTCTPYHKFYVMTSYHSYEEIRAGDLQPGHKLIKFDLPVIEGTEELPYAYDNGFYTADGCLVKGSSRLYCYGEKKDLIPHLTSVESWYMQHSEDRAVGHTRRLKPKYFVPSSQYTVESRLKWFAGLCDGDGTIARNGENESIQVGSIHKEFLKEVQLMLQTLGVSSKVTNGKEAGLYRLPDGHGGHKQYPAQNMYRLLVSSSGLFKLAELGFKTHRLVWEHRYPQRSAEQFVTVTEVIDVGRVDDTYCFNEPKRHMGVFNGILTGQCTEIFLPTSEERTAVCCLSSVNLEYFDEWKDDPFFIHDTMEMLDNVLTYFIRNAPDPVARARYSAIRERSVGLGALGLHAYFQKNGIPFDSVVAKVKNRAMFKHIHEKCAEADRALLALRGPCEDARDAGVPRRFSHWMAVAPNASSSLIMGNTSPSIEPYRANVFRQDTMSGAFVYKNRFLKQQLAEVGMDTDEVWASIIANDGSVQHLEVNDTIKEVFKTAMEIDQRWVIDMAADRQAFIDQGQSLNVFFPPDVSVKYLHAIHFLAWKQGLKSLYYCRSDKLKKADKVGLRIERQRLDDEINLADVANGDVCIACEG